MKSVVVQVGLSPKKELVTYRCETMALATKQQAWIYAAELAHFNFFIIAFINTQPLPTTSHHI